MAAGVLERHASVAGSAARTARAPPAGLGPTLPPETPVRAGPCARPRERRLPGRLPRAPAARPEADRGGACSRRARGRSIASVTRSLPAPDSAAGRTITSTGAMRSTSPKSAGIALVRQIGHEEPRLPPRATIAPRSRARLGAGPGTPQGGHQGLMSGAARSPIHQLRLVAASTRPPLPPRVLEGDTGRRSPSPGRGAPTHGRPRSRPSSRPPPLADPSPPA